MLEPVAYLTLYEQVYDKLRAAIMEGAFAAGETLTIRNLAQQLGTSVMPVREALRRLATEGAIDVLPNRSIRLPPLAARRVDEVFRLRTLLEAEAAAMAATRIDSAGISVLRGLQREFAASVKAGTVTRVLRAGQQLHFTIYEAAQTPMMLSMIGMLWLQSGPWLAEPLRRSFNKATVRAFAGAVGAHHGELIDAVERRDSQRAASAICAEMVDLREHVRTTSTSME